MVWISTVWSQDQWNDPGIGTKFLFSEGTPDRQTGRGLIKKIFEISRRRFWADRLPWGLWYASGASSGIRCRPYGLPRHVRLSIGYIWWKAEMNGVSISVWRMVAGRLPQGCGWGTDGKTYLSESGLSGSVGLARYMVCWKTKSYHCYYSKNRRPVKAGSGIEVKIPSPGCPLYDETSVGRLLHSKFLYEKKLPDSRNWLPTTTVCRTSPLGKNQ